MQKLFKTATEFSLHIEEICIEEGLNHMDAVLFYCKTNFIDPDEIKGLINRTLKDKIEVAARENGYLPRIAKLDLEFF